MIEINAETRKIFFYYELELIKNNPHRFDDKIHEFDLLSGYICPECNKVLEAYYVGTLPIEDQDGKWNRHPYLPTRNTGYNISDPHYEYGHEYGGGYLKLMNHKETYCKIQVSKTVGVIEGIKEFISGIIPTPEIVPTELMLKTFAADIFENKIPGIFLIEDVCKIRAPKLAIDIKEFSKNVSWNSNSDRYKEYEWETMFYKLVIRDKEVQIINS